MKYNRKLKKLNTTKQSIKQIYVNTFNNFEIYNILRKERKKDR